MGFFDKLRAGLSRTKEQILGRFEEIVEQADRTEQQRSRPVDVDTIEALEELLISADVGLPATEQIVTAVRDRARHGESLRDLVKTEIRKIFAAIERNDPEAAAEACRAHVAAAAAIAETLLRDKAANGV